MRHELKTDSEVFQAVVEGKKTYEIRFDDRGFEIGDTLVLRETVCEAVSEMGKSLVYTGREHSARITHILRGPVYGLMDGWVILSISPREKE